MEKNKNNVIVETYNNKLKHHNHAINQIFNFKSEKKNESYMSKIFMLQLIHIYKRNDSLNKIMNISKLNYFINKETNFKCL